MLRFDDPLQAGRWCAQRGDATLGLVPTMGALHEGHLELTRRAVGENDLACVSVFVNPLQFDRADDFARYPRDLDADARALEAAGCDMVFTGTLETFFPGRTLSPTELRSEDLVDPGPAAAGLEGDHREGHFRGVATIVRRLLELARPTRAYFGEKDLQQTLVVRDLARREGGPEIVVCPTVREPSGLARSSRNLLLDEHQRALATRIHGALCAARDAWQAGERQADGLAAALRSALDVPGIEIEYAEVRDPERWSARAPAGTLQRAVALIAARVGGVRLIDNLRMDVESLDAEGAA